MSDEEYKEKHLSEFDCIKGAIKIIERVFADVEVSDDENIIVFVRGTKVGVRGKRFKNLCGSPTVDEWAENVANEVLTLVIYELTKTKDQANDQ